MNKRYIDFVPSSGVKTKQPATKRPVVKDARTVGSAKIVRTSKTEVMYRSVPKAPKVEPHQVSKELKRDDGLRLGVIEDLNTKFMKNEVEKRPLNDGRIARKETPTKKDALKEAKSRRLIGRKLKKTGVAPVEKPVEKVEKKAKQNVAKATYKMPKSPFINQEKVVKRPLSKNTYQKKIEVPEEKPSGPVAIIAKPEKDKKVSLIVTIIITIILGAAAGTVAFLLLPK